MRKRQIIRSETEFLRRLRPVPLEPGSRIGMVEILIIAANFVAHMDYLNTIDYSAYPARQRAEMLLIGGQMQAYCVKFLPRIKKAIAAGRLLGAKIDQRTAADALICYQNLLQEGRRFLALAAPARVVVYEAILGV